MFFPLFTQANIQLNRKILQELAIHEPLSFQEVLAEAKKARSATTTTDMDLEA